MPLNRKTITDILNNADLDDPGKVDAILNARGEEISAANARYTALEQQYNDAVAAGAARQDYDAVVQERDTLRAEKADREMTDRFNAVVGTNKFKNTFTADGVRKLFADAVALPENEGKTDADIFASISKDKEAEWYESTVHVSMTPSAGRIVPPDGAKAYVESEFKNNPWYGE